METTQQQGPFVNIFDDKSVSRKHDTLEQAHHALPDRWKVITIPFSDLGKHFKAGEKIWMAKDHKEWKMGEPYCKEVTFTPGEGIFA